MLVIGGIDMISKSVIMAILAGIAVTGLIPLIAGLVLLAMHKIKASSFWAGVLTYIIAMIVYSIVGGIVSAVMMFSSGGMSNIVSESVEPSVGMTVMLMVIMSAVFMLSMGICIGSCMKKTRTFKGAVSCGLGFGAGYMVTTAIGLVSNYMTCASINSGDFDRQYVQLIEMGMLDKEAVSAMKEVYTSMTVTDALVSIISAVVGAALFAASAVFIMRAVCARILFAGVGVSFALFAFQSMVQSIIPNAVAGVVIAAAVGAAALIFALRMREQIVPPPKPSYASDSFMQTVENVTGKSEDAEVK